MITWEQRRGQIKHLLYELCLTGRIDKATFCEQLHDLNNVAPIVRCKDCKWADLCKDPEFYEYKGANGFCSKGAREDEVEDEL